MRGSTRVVRRKVEKDRRANSVELPMERGVPTLDLTLFAPMDPTGLAQAQSSIFEMPDDDQDSFRFDDRDRL